MAIYGLQTDFMNTLLNQYFGLSTPNTEMIEIYVGLGLEQEGSNVNIESFDEVFAGRPLAGYERARVVFGKPVNGMISNINEVVFAGAAEAWTSTKPVAMIGLFNTMDYEDSEAKLIKPLIVLALPRSVTVDKGEVVMMAPNAINLNLSDL